MLEAIRNSLLGKLHHPHAAMIEHGIHAVTFEAVKKKNDNKVKSLPDSLNGLVQLLEVLTRMFDQLDE